MALTPRGEISVHERGEPRAQRHDTRRVEPICREERPGHACPVIAFRVGELRSPPPGIEARRHKAVRPQCALVHERSAPCD
eukprot:829165-Prymnesium_polylepis.1